jgi:hypothetical protein
MARSAGGASGWPVRDEEQGSRPAGDPLDPGVVSPVAELRGHERKAAEELGRGKTGVEERKTVEGGDRTGRAPWSGMPKYSPPMPHPRRAIADDGVIGWSRVRAVRGQSTISRFHGQCRDGAREPFLTATLIASDQTATAAGTAASRRLVRPIWLVTQWEYEKLRGLASARTC